jgi:hypothetical protein
MIQKLKKTATVAVWLVENVVPLLIWYGAMKPISPKTTEAVKRANTIIKKLK